MTKGYGPSTARLRLVLGVAAVAFGLAVVAAQAQSPVEQFYRTKKTIDVVIGFTPGGGYDAYARLVARYMGNHIPGNPTLVPRNMTGAGGRTAAAYVYDVAPKDGTVIGVSDQTIPLQQALGDAGVKLDSRLFNWIGNPIADNNVIVAWYTSGIRTIDNAREREVTLGGNGIDTSSIYPTALNAIAGTKFKLILGYPGGNETNLAMERGEVEGRENSWASWKAIKPEWVRDGKIIMLAQVGLDRAPDLPNVPTLIDLAANDVDRAAMKLLSAPAEIGRPLFAPPSVPEDRVKALRDAFDETMKDPAFLADAKKANLDVNPVPGNQLQRIVADIVDAPLPAKQRLQAIMEILTNRDTSK